jgi:hypothetical protein
MNACVETVGASTCYSVGAQNLIWSVALIQELVKRLHLNKNRSQLHEIYRQFRVQSIFLMAPVNQLAVANRILELNSTHRTAENRPT